MAETKAKRKVRDVGELIFYICLIALPLIQVAVFYIYVNFNSFLLIFQNYNAQEAVFETNIKYFVNNLEKFWTTYATAKDIIFELKNAAIAWIWTAIIGRVLAIMFSYYIYKKWAFSKTFKFFLFLPSILPSILLVLMFKYFVNDAIPGYMVEFTGESMTSYLNQSATRFGAVMFFNIWASFGTQILIYTGAMDQISPEIIEAGEMDGVNALQEFIYIVMPMIMPTVATFLMASVATFFTNQASLYAFFGNNLDPEYATIGYRLYDLISVPGIAAQRGNYPYASLIGVLCTFISLPLTLLVRKVLQKMED